MNIFNYWRTERCKAGCLDYKSERQNIGKTYLVPYERCLYQVSKSLLLREGLALSPEIV